MRIAVSIAVQSARYEHGRLPLVFIFGKRILSTCDPKGSLDWWTVDDVEEILADEFGSNPLVVEPSAIA
ncbi:hypothetical protein [Halovivax cerinus]|uniref:Uncharacterized protein n=1 Tax=Halovivax cerinus TaxID=1487865 RepID=A0ABD5NPG2_9EURY|nr:hypothetical protein [Halovivax cerinus]